MVMVALRSGRSCLTTLPMDRPVRAWMQWAQDSRHSEIVYVVSWPLTLYLILRSVPG
jgi:hypothetical protein